ncbi:hypothetical protein HCA63_06915 [Listeria booriae]|uniref:hypothetical protein n=1 Tax=Listeria booriae TaxID=1552123 RepID=UPI001625D6E9|nr:hypothetical protein [Listeria booriae]MBC1888080.1 hypothetical protein [Listeria booriae]
MSYISLDTIKYFIHEFEKKLHGYSLQKNFIDELTHVVVLNDSLVLLIQIEAYIANPCLNAEQIHGDDRKNKYLCFPIKGEHYYTLHIEELTYNEIDFKYNHTKFVNILEELTQIQHLSLTLSFSKFKGYSRLYWCMDTETNSERIANLLPELKLRERYNAWKGIRYNFIVIELTDISGEIERAVVYTSQKPHTHVINMGRQWIKCGNFPSGSVRMNYSKFHQAFTSWKGICRQKRLENHLKYFSIEKYFKEKDDVWRYADIILEKANNLEYADFERSTYVKPSQKWISEELVYTLTKKIYPDYVVIYQHRPFFLKSSNGGQMSYDIFISGLDIAIEYQGKQHFEPVDFFGGDEAFLLLKKRDFEKKRLSEENGIRLVYINYWDEITPELIKDRAKI